MPTSSHTVIAAEILAYLLKHPQAQDTLEGIAHWWMLEQKIEESTSMIKKALAGLVAGGWVQTTLSSDGHLHYRINSKKAVEISSLIERD
jgi:hypothetical protein